MGGGRSKSTVTGFRYYFGVLMGLCRGPIDELTHIRIGDLEAYEGTVSADTDNVNIDKESLFGGDKKEGGVQGPMMLMMGTASQDVYSRDIPNAYPGGSGTVNVAELLGAPDHHIPSMRGVTTALFRGYICANNPYPKPWEFRINRSKKGWSEDDCWYPEKATILLADGAIKAMNPAHILYQCITDPDWGRGLPRSLLHDEMWQAAANTLCDEGFGLCLAWRRQDSLADFMQSVINHIGGVIYVDRTSGKVALRLLRADYDPDALPVFDPTSGLLSMERDDAASDEAGHNEIVVKWIDPVLKGERATRAQSLAAIQSAGAIISTSVDYPGIPTADLAARVAQRDLRLQVGLQRYTLEFDRRAWKLQAGVPFKVSYAERGIGEVVLRCATVDDTVHSDGRIRVKAVEDVFGLDEIAYIQTETPTWAPPNRSAEPIDEAVMLETPYFALAARLSPGDMAVLDVTDVYWHVHARKPTPLSVAYQVWSAVDPASPASSGENGFFTAGATLAEDIGLYDTEIPIEAGYNLSEIAADEALLVGGEIMRVVSVDIPGATITVARGCADTIPLAHTAGTRAWSMDNGFGSDFRLYAPGETILAKLLTFTSTELLDPDVADTLTLETVGRQGRPYPPGNLRFNGVPYGEATATYCDLVITWTHRNRVTQTDQLIEHGAASITPEDGTTYNLRIYNADDDELLREETGITGTTYTYLAGVAVADGDHHNLRIELESERDGLVSFSVYNHTFQHYAVTGFDYAFDIMFDGGCEYEEAGWDYLFGIGFGDDT